MVMSLSAAIYYFDRMNFTGSIVILFLNHLVLSADQ